MGEQIIRRIPKVELSAEDKQTLSGVKVGTKIRISSGASMTGGEVTYAVTGVPSNSNSTYNLVGESGYRYVVPLKLANDIRSGVMIILPQEGK